jgi:hypothetical protein
MDRGRGPGLEIYIQGHRHRVLELGVVLEKEDKGKTNHQDPKSRFDRSHIISSSLLNNSFEFVVSSFELKKDNLKNLVSSL